MEKNIEKKNEKKFSRPTVQAVDLADFVEKINNAINPEIANNDSVNMAVYTNSKNQANGRMSVTFDVHVKVNDNEKRLEVAVLISRSEYNISVMIINCFHNDLIFLSSSKDAIDKSVACAASYISKSTARILNITLSE